MNFSRGPKEPAFYILPAHVRGFPHKRLCLGSQDRSAMPNEAYGGRGVQQLGKKGWGGRRVRLQVHVFSKSHLKTGTHERPVKRPSGPQRPGALGRGAPAAPVLGSPLCSSACLKPAGKAAGWACQFRVTGNQACFLLTCLA